MRGDPLREPNFPFESQVFYPWAAETGYAEGELPGHFPEPTPQLQLPQADMARASCDLCHREDQQCKEVSLGKEAVGVSGLECRLTSEERQSHYQCPCSKAQTDPGDQDRLREVGPVEGPVSAR